MDVSSWAGLAVAAATLAVASIAGWWWRRRQGRPQAMTAARQRFGDQRAELLASLGVVAGTPATLLQFSTAFCVACRATRVTCGQLAAQHEGLVHVEVDAESQLAAVRAFGVWHTPTVFVVDRDGQLIIRIAGQPTRAQLTEAVAPLLPDTVRP